MKKGNSNDVNYKLPNGLSDFQREMYKHLIDWKWGKNINEPGIYQKKDKSGVVRTYEYDAILPKSVHNKYPIIYPTILSDLLKLKEQFNFKLHQHFNHMASSQAANVNLFLPILLHARANEILKVLKSDFKQLDTHKLYKGFRIEYWDGKGNEAGLLGDHNPRSGTDSDIAIAYTNIHNEPCLWLIEHKLTEKEFTQCGGEKSKNRDASKHNCNKSFSEIIQNKNLCYYHEHRKFEYWNITEKYQSFFKNHASIPHCPFIGGMNQLWRNQILGLALEANETFKHVYFSVVHHPENLALNKSIEQYRELIDNNPKFSVYTSADVINAANKLGETEINIWIEWYKGLYRL